MMDIAILGVGGGIDAYVYCVHRKQKLKTTVVTTKSDFLFWNEEFLIPMPMPLMSGRIIM